ncbi:cytochrome c [Planococcus shenhongbingii]|uniref:Cytochrome c n=1 Tax=Planococcus shenhongbingii TaxID=3058398 RepID=A0ABT8N967_9BACL|nr:MULTISPECIES: cytochrome c [unclassified Planococcus (in: firmicutes)]MDN7244437.1 cytochrome c [Planococcus sp. N017]WKA57600.1 cytochrome c [Planococcus sp. N016]
MKKQLMALLFGSALVLGACGGGGDEAAPPADTPDSAGTEETSVDPEQVVQQNCISCHGENLEGAGNFPALNNVGARLSEEEIRGVIENGKGAMPAGIIEGEEADAVAKWLSEKK